MELKRPFKFNPFLIQTESIRMAFYSRVKRSFRHSNISIWHMHKQQRRVVKRIIHFATIFRSAMKLFVCASKRRQRPYLIQTFSHCVIIHGGQLKIQWFIYYSNSVVSNFSSLFLVFYFFQHGKSHSCVTTNVTIHLIIIMIIIMNGRLSHVNICARIKEVFGACFNQTSI